MRVDVAQLVVHVEEATKAARAAAGRSVASEHELVKLQVRRRAGPVQQARPGQERHGPVQRGRSAFLWPPRSPQRVRCIGNLVPAPAHLSGLCPRTRRPGGPGPRPSRAAHARTWRPHAGAEAGDTRGAGAQCGPLRWGRRSVGTDCGGGGQFSFGGPEDGRGRTRQGTPGSAPAARPRHPAQGFALRAPDVAAARANGRGRWGGSSSGRSGLHPLKHVFFRSQSNLHGVPVGLGRDVLSPCGSARVSREPRVPLQCAPGLSARSPGSTHPWAFTLRDTASPPCPVPTARALSKVLPARDFRTGQV